jgi:hypothetical protein
MSNTGSYPIKLRFWRDDVSVDAAADPGFPERTSKAFNEEPSALAGRLINIAGSDAPPGFPEFVKYRFWRPLQYSLKASFWYGWASSGLSVLAIAGGLASSALAAGPGSHDTLVAALGLLVVVTTTVNRIWRPGLRAVVRSQTANQLRREGWAFVCGRGNYVDLEPRARAPVFVDEVERINVTAEAVDEQSADSDSDDSR